METLPHGMPHKLMDPYFLQELSLSGDKKSTRSLEIIELRSTEDNRKLLESQLQKLINEVERETKKQAARSC